ncbi:hypothetical protein Holit_00419 [Hollandina sp. SP2]
MALSVLKKLRFACWGVFWGGLLLGSCNQDPIFYSISLEVEPVDPRIVGMPTHIVTVEDKFYVASKFSTTIQYYDNTGWTELPQRPGGPILDLAATESHLYALTGDPGSTALYKWDPANEDEDWEPVANAEQVQSIYGAKNTLFAGAMIGTSTFTMLYESDDGSLVALSGGSGFLQGAVHNGTAYYLAGTGIYKLEDNETNPTFTLVDDTEGLPMAGLITLEDNTVVGVSGKKLLTIKPDDEVQQYDMGATFTGAMALWGEGGEGGTETGEEAGTEGEETEQDERTALLLLLGIQGSSTSTTHGYREILLSNGTLNSSEVKLRTPGTDPSSVSNYDKYNSSLGKHPVTTLFQAADGVLFAGTTKNGLWSYRNEQWNAEP